MISWESENQFALRQKCEISDASNFWCVGIGFISLFYINEQNIWVLDCWLNKNKEYKAVNLD